MGMINPLKEKYHSLYWDIADRAASQSLARRRQVGACIVAPTGMIALGWNGMPAGNFSNDPEVWSEARGEWVSKPEVVHAERNAIDKMTNQGVPLAGSVLFCTTACCLECAKSIHAIGVERVFYRDAFTRDCGIDYLTKAGTPIEHVPEWEARFMGSGAQGDIGDVPAFRVPPAE